MSIAYAALRADSDPAKISPNEFVRFDDYREVAPGVWLPFREVRALPHASESVPGKRQLIRSELRVEEARTDRDLGDQYGRLLPKDGDRVQDQRYIVPVNLRHRADRDAGEIRKLAEAQYSKGLEGEAILKGLSRPVADLVGKQAPALTDGDWIGGRPPDLAGKPYLLHFWATWCGPCKGDFPRLKTLAESGMVILGMHPAGTPPEEVEKAIRDHQLSYPTFLARPEGGDPNPKRIGGYPSGIFPYCILVDAQGRVAGHGSLTQVLEKFGVADLMSPR